MSDHRFRDKWNWAIGVARHRREKQRMAQAGYDSFCDKRMQRGGLWQAKIVDAKVSVDGNRVYYRIAGAENKERRDIEA